MLNVTKELTALARKLGYTGKAPDTVAKAINAITSVAGEGGDGCDCEPGYEVTETQLFSETVTTSKPGPAPIPTGMLDYASLIEAPSLTITFDDSTYTVPLTQIQQLEGTANIYGEVGKDGPDFSTYPFCIVSANNENIIYTETAGTYNISASGEALTVSNDFAKAVNTSIAPLPVLQIVVEQTTWQEVYDAIKSGKIVYYAKDLHDDKTVIFCLALRTYIDEHDGSYNVKFLYYDGEMVGSDSLSANSPTDRLFEK